MNNSFPNPGEVWKHKIHINVYILILDVYKKGDYYNIKTYECQMQKILHRSIVILEYDTFFDFWEKIAEV